MSPTLNGVNRSKVLQTKCPPGKKVTQHTDTSRLQGNKEIPCTSMAFSSAEPVRVFLYNRTASKTHSLSEPTGLHEPRFPYLCSKEKSIVLTRITSVCTLCHKQALYPSPILPFQAQTVPIEWQHAMQKPQQKRSSDKCNKKPEAAGKN